MDSPDARSVAFQARLKTWIRLLRLTRSVEAQLRKCLRTGFDTTLPRFEVMAALYRRRDNVTMSELSRLLLVSNGNATAVVDRLTATQRIVWVNPEGRSAPWPDSLRACLTAHRPADCLSPSGVGFRQRVGAGLTLSPYLGIPRTL